MRTIEGERERGRESLQLPEIRTANGISINVYRPSVEITNEDIEGWKVETAHGNLLTAASIVDKLGIERRYVETEDRFYIAGQAAYGVLLEKPSEERQLDAIFVTTSFPEAIPLSQRLNEHLKHLRIDAPFTRDVHAACSGFVRSLADIKDHEEEFMGKRVLIVTAEKYSDDVFDLRKDGYNADPALSQTIFSDGGTGMDFVYGEDLRVLAVRSGPLLDRLSGAIKMPIDYSVIEPNQHRIVEKVPVSESGKIEQNGKVVYGSVLRYIPNLIREIVEEAGLTPDDIDLVIPHQGSGRMVLGLEEILTEYKGKVVLDIEEGNFSSGSIPKAMAKAQQEGRMKKGQNIVVAGFGAGLYASVAVIRT